MSFVGVGQILYVSFFPFPFGIEGGIWDVIVLLHDHCLSICFVLCICICVQVQTCLCNCKCTERQVSSVITNARRVRVEV